jgi:type IV secretion system protein VirB6/type IV secretion system protein TrbL
MLGEAMQSFVELSLQDSILEAAKDLFGVLSVASLVWTMGMLIVRQDVGEVLMELLRFIVVTGTFYWLLINASDRDGGGGFVNDIVSSFFQMSNGDPQGKTIVSNANGLLAKGLHVFYSVIHETHGAEVGDALIAGGIAVVILVVCALMAAQVLVGLVMAWMLSYAGIFLLGFGGARWTASIAISYYKHVLAIGVALLALHFISAAATGFLSLYDESGASEGPRSFSQFPYLGKMLAASILMLVLSIKVPQLLYTLVTGSQLGMFVGMATMTGHAFASGGGAAWASAASALPPGGGGRGGGHERDSSSQADSVMDAVQRSASVTSGMGDPWHASAGVDPFGMPRSADPYRGSGSGSVVASHGHAGRAVRDDVVRPDYAAELGDIEASRAGVRPERAGDL